MCDVTIWGCMSAFGKALLHFCDGSIIAENLIETAEQQMLPSRPHLFQGHPSIFQYDNGKPNLTHIT